jgi:hypothetical protein
MELCPVDVQLLLRLQEAVNTLMQLPAGHPKLQAFWVNFEVRRIGVNACHHHHHHFTCFRQGSLL